MYSGAEKNADGSLTGWQRFTPQEWATRSVFTVKQDVKLLNEQVIRTTLTEPLKALVQKRQLDRQPVDWFLPHISSSTADPVAGGG
jgi:3-oxoacyl-[acyl-carrier-protein] synthase-3